MTAFLRHHVYEVNGATPGALVGTFLFSIAVHEVFIWGAMAGHWRVPWLALISLVQLPLRPLLRLIPKNVLGNFLFWLGLQVGLGCVGILYARDMRR